MGDNNLDILIKRFRDKNNTLQQLKKTDYINYITKKYQLSKLF